MATWAGRQRAKYTALFILIFAVVIVVPLFFIFYDEPTCFDGKQNGDEDGIDCGGSCEQVCSFEAAEPIVLWSRLFEVLPGSWSAVALIENPNADIGALDVPYTFQIRDINNLLIYERKGTTFIAPKETFPVFETRIVTGQRTPRRVFFEFTAEPLWQHFDDGTELVVTDRSFENATATPRLRATIENRGDDAVSDVEVVGVVFDTSGNAIGASQTVIDYLERKDTADIVFTWPAPFSEGVSRTSVYPKVRPQR